MSDSKSFEVINELYIMLWNEILQHLFGGEGIFLSLHYFIALALKLMPCVVTLSKVSEVDYQRGKF